MGLETGEGGKENERATNKQQIGNNTIAIIKYMKLEINADVHKQVNSGSNDSFHSK